MRRLAGAAVLIAIVLTRALAKPRSVDAAPVEASSGTGGEVEAASQAFLNFVLLPLWMVPGFGDYLCHRASKIERTSGTHESLTHMLMISSTGIGIACGLLFEINEAVLAVMIGAALAHEAIVLWDVAYAIKLRPPSATEQHFHSFLEVLPFTGLAFTMCLNPRAVAALAGRGPVTRRFRLEWKRDPGAPLYLAGIGVLATFTLFVPYAEELLRCYRVDHTILPHQQAKS